MTAGLWFGIGAYTIWGLFPLYWRLIEFVPAGQIVAHRIAWSFAVLVLVVGIRGWRRRGAAVRPGTGVVAVYAIAAALISANWFLYVWAVNRGFVVETSLGYFITPLVNVLLGVLVLRERLRPGQQLAVALASAGVAYLTWVYGDVPWIALGLATTFGSYGLAKKKAALEPLTGLMLETGILFLPAVVFLAVSESEGQGAFGHVAPWATLLLAGAGIVTTVPLLMFARAVQTVPLSGMGILQFIAPTIQFGLGVFFYREPFTRQQLGGFSLVWSALIVFALEGLRHSRAGSRP